MQTDYGNLLASPEIGVVLCDENTLPFNEYVGAVLDSRLVREKYDTLKHFETEAQKRLSVAVNSILNPLLKKQGLEPIVEEEIPAFATGLLSYLFERRKR